MSQSLKVLLSCFIGASIGTFVALEMSPMFWWTGLIIGGLVGYINYEFRKVITAISTAWHATTSWQPDNVFWCNFFKLWPATTVFMTTAAIGVVTPLMFGMIALDKEKPTITDLIVTGIGLAMSIILYGAVFALSKLDDVKKADSSEDYLAQQRKWMFSVNPLRVYLWLLPKSIALAIGWALCGLTWLFVKLFTRIPISIKFWRTFLWHWFCEIHSEIRLLCGVDAAIGVAIGYFAGSVLTGGLAGALVGVLNFEVLSIRVLKLVPRSASLFH